MTRRTPARLLAPLALVATAIALVAVVTSGGDSTGSEEDLSAPAVTATAKKGAKKTKGATTKNASDGKDANAGKTYKVKPGDTPSSIAAANGMSTAELLDLNPNADPNNLTIGQTLKLGP